MPHGAAGPDSHMARLVEECCRGVRREVGKMFEASCRELDKKFEAVDKEFFDAYGGHLGLRKPSLRMLPGASQTTTVQDAPVGPPSGSQVWCEPAVSPSGAVSPRNPPQHNQEDGDSTRPGGINAELTWAAALHDPGATRVPPPRTWPRVASAAPGPAFLIQRCV